MKKEICGRREKKCRFLMGFFCDGFIAVQHKKHKSSVNTKKHKYIFNIMNTNFIQPNEV